MIQMGTALRRTTIAAVAVGVVSLLPGVAHAQEVDYTNTVTVAAGAKVEIEADIATLTIGVRGAGQEATVATRRVASKTQSVLEALRRVGVTEEELSTGGVRLSRVTDRKGNFVRYVATASIKVKTERLDDLGRIIDAAVAGGATSLRGLDYDVKDRSAAVDQALRDAMAFARDKATALAEADGRQVGEAIVISEFDSRPPRSASVEVQGAVLEGSSRDGGAAAFIPLVPPTLSAQARITVTFELI